VNYAFGIRWQIAGLIFVATCINLMNRTSVGLLYSQFGREIGISREQYGLAGAALLLAYTLSQSFSGRFFDRYGARVGYSISIVVWCGAAMAHSLIVGARSFALCSFSLGIGEAGNWPGAAKVIAEWFPDQERAMGMAIFNAGSASGAVFAPLLVAGWFGPLFGWRATFALIGLLGFIWLGFWLKIYRPLADHPSVPLGERLHIRQGQVPAIGSEPSPLLPDLLRQRKTWAILLARFFVDPIWWFYMLWLPVYLSEYHHLNLREIGIFQWVPYLCAACGSLFGGWLSGWLIRKGCSLSVSRRTVLVFAACLMPVGVFAAQATNPRIALGFISMVLFGFQMWIVNLQALPGDCFPASNVGTVAGLGGSAAGASSFALNFGVGWLITHYGYSVVLMIPALLAPLGIASLLIFIGSIGRAGMLRPAQAACAR
jgi:MFS transporter, ACS family, hexuronate transporter